MSISERLSQVWILIPVVLLLVVGFVIAVRSGRSQIAERRGLRDLIASLSSTIALVGLCLAVLMLMQGIVGYNLKATW